LTPGQIQALLDAIVTCQARLAVNQTEPIFVVYAVSNDRASKIKIGDWEVSRATCTLHKGEVEVKITPRSMDVLNYLAENGGMVISPDELLGHFWQGSVTSDHAVHKAVAELRSALGDDAHNPTYIKTFPKRGYALIAQIGTLNAADLKPYASILPSRRMRDLRTSFAVFAAVIAALLVIFARTPATTQTPQVAQLAVLPFINRELDTDNQFLADGLRESLIHGLSKLSNLQVLSPEDSVNYPRNRKTSGVVQSDADHVLQGSVQTADGRLRVTVQLVRVQDGSHQYSDQFDLPLNNLFGVQDEIVSNVVRALSIHLDERERSQMLDWGTTNAIAYESFIRGEFYNNQFSPRDWQRAIDYHLAAVDLDPTFLNAWHGAATAANNLAVYSSAERIQELSTLITSIHDQVSRLVEPESELLSSLREIRLRMSGDNQLEQEKMLRAQIMSGTPPDFAIAHYALFLIGARLYDEAAQLLERAAEVGPFQISPDEVWSYRNSIEPPERIVVSRKLQLLQRPYHVAFLGTVATHLAWLGDFEQASIYLERQRLIDQDEILVHLSDLTIAFLNGSLRPDSPDLQAFYRSGEDYYYNNGVLSFMLGDVDKGVHYWSKLRAVQLRRLFNVAHSSEKYFASNVLEDPRYHAALEQLGAGISWQRRLMEGVIDMEAVLDVKLSDQAREAYENQTFMTRNNLWSEDEWAAIAQKRLKIPAQ